MNEEIPGQPNPAPVPPQADPLAAAPPASDPLAAPLYNAPPPPPAFTYPSQPGYSAQPGYSGQPGYPAQPGNPAAYPPPPDGAFPPPPDGSYPPPGYPPPGAYPPPGYPGQQFPPPPGYPPYPMFGAPVQGKVNGSAIASLIFGILGGVLFSVVFGIVALTQIPKRGDRGKGLAIAGLSLSGFWVAAIAVVITVGALTESTAESTDLSSAGRPTVEVTTATPRPTSTATSVGKRATEDLLLGDCIEYIDEDDSADEFTVSLCSVPHAGEVYSFWTFPKGSYPGEKKVEAQASDHCNDALDKYAVGKFADAQYWYIYPSADSWSDDRRVTCIAVPKSGQWTGSMVHK